jgi:hypothetical protein
MKIINAKQCLVDNVLPRSGSNYVANKLHWLIRSFGLILLATSIIKLGSASGSARVLQQPDPIFTILFQHLIFTVGILELGIALVCLFSKRAKLQAGMVAWLATNFILYRVTLVLIGWHRPCPCLGNLTDALHIPPETADNTMKIILAYLFIGSYATLFLIWRQKRKDSSSEPLLKEPDSAF